MPTPPSQRARTIGFRSNFGAGIDLVIRPEEYSRFEPSRLAVQQTLGGAWADSFDRGIIVMKISGTTGWHGGDPRTALLSGEAQFHQLRREAFTGWHARRAEIIAGGGDPSVVELTFADTLDGFRDVVAPKSFSLRRSKTRPLLFLYSIELLVLQDVAAPLAGIGGLNTQFGYLLGAASLGGVADAIADALAAFP